MTPGSSRSEASSAGAPGSVSPSDGPRSRAFDDPFDPGAATAPTRRVPVDHVVDLLHVTHAAPTITRYAAAMKEGHRFPPIAVFAIGPRTLIVADGHKRFSACKSLGVDHITVELWGVRRLAADLWRQSGAHTAEAAHAASQIFRGPEGRRQARDFVARTVAHWRRMVVSALRLARRN